MKIMIAIDGACKGNGSVNCISGAGMFAVHMDASNRIQYFHSDYSAEFFSTNQRGELHALLMALRYVNSHQSVDEVQIITDSEYMFNTLTKKWYNNWRNNGWLKADLTPVKNDDLWKLIIQQYEMLNEDTVSVYHIKGHVIPIGEVTALGMLKTDDSGKTLYEHCLAQYYFYKDKKADKIQHAQELSQNNNGFKLPENIFECFVAMNATVDNIAKRGIKEIEENN